MELSTMLMAGKAVASIGKVVFGGGSKGAKKLAKKERELAKQYYDIDMKMVTEAYQAGLSNMMSNYAIERYRLSQEAGQVASDLNLTMAKEGVNLADSSIKNDIQTQLDTEFEINTQNLLQGQYNEGAMLVANLTSQRMNLSNTFANKISQINRTEANVQSQLEDNMMSSLVSLGFKVAGDYGEYAGKDKTFSKFLTDFKF